MEDCLFCKIAKKEIPATIVYETENLVAFNDIHPQAKVHIILIPKIHISSLLELEDESLGGKLLLTAKTIAEKEDISKSGFRVLTNSGKNAGQTINHLHFHILGGQELGPIA